MPRDRFSELAMSPRVGGSGDQVPTASTPTNPNLTRPASLEIDIGDQQPDEIAKMADFFAEVDKIRSGIAGIKKRVQEIEQFHGKQLTAISTDESSTKGNLDQLMDAANEDIQKVRQKLKAMEAANKKVGADNTKTELTAEQRIRVTQHGNLGKKFIEVVGEYQDIQTRYKKKYRDRLERQYKIVKPNATEEEIEQVMDTSSGSGGASIFAQQILNGAQHAEAKKALHDIQERHQDIIKMEKSIIELHQLFVDMAVLVNAQGEMLNQVDKYVASAAEHTNKGVEEMRKAVKSQKKSRKRMCVILFLIIALIVVGSIMGSYFGKES